MATRTLYKVDLDDHQDIVQHSDDIMMNWEGRIRHGRGPFHALEQWESVNTIVGKRNPDGGITLGVCNGFHHEPGEPATMRVAWLNHNETLDEAQARAASEASWETTAAALAVEGLFELDSCNLPDFHEGPCGDSR